MINMYDGVVTFKGSTISNTTAMRVRLSHLHVPRRMSHVAGVGGGGASRCGGRGCVGCAQYGGGGVVYMYDGAVTFKGGTISSTEAMRVRLSRLHFPRRLLQTSHFALHIAHDGAYHVVRA